MNSSNLQNQLQRMLKQLLHFRVPLFLLLLAIVYGFIVWRADTLQHAQPQQSAIASKLESSTHIDQATINKIKQLQDNSVSVQALFNQARQNPFQE